MERLNVDMDLSEMAIQDASIQLKYKPPHIMCAAAGQYDAKRLAELMRWSWEVDDSLSGDEWKLRVGRTVLYSPGA